MDKSRGKTSQFEHLWQSLYINGNVMINSLYKHTLLGENEQKTVQKQLKQLKQNIYNK